MPWNQPGQDGSKPPARGGRPESSLEETLKRWQRRLQGLWQPDGRRGPVLAVIAALIVAIWFASGYYEINSSERGVVQRFGGYLRTDGPGRGWHWPWPIETLTRVDVESIDSVDARALMLTADTNLLNVSWNVQYRRTDPLQVLFQLQDPQAALRQDAEGVLRRAVAAQPMSRVLAGDRRRQLAQQVRATLQQMLDAEHAGMNIQGVNITDVQVPDQVLAAQRDVDKAQMDASRVRQQAQDYAGQIQAAAESQAAQQRVDAQNYRTQAVATADGDAQRFTTLAAAYAKAPAVTRERMYIDTIKTILARSHKVIVDTGKDSNNTLYLPLDKLMGSGNTTTPAAKGAAKGAAGSGAAGSGAAAASGGADQGGTPAGSGGTAAPAATGTPPQTGQPGAATPDSSAPAAPQANDDAVQDEADRSRARPER